MLLCHTEILSCQEAIYAHTRGVLPKQRIEARLNLVDHLLGWKIGVYQIAEVEHVGVAPVTTKARGDRAVALLVAARKDARCDVEVLNIIYLVPLLAT